MTHVFANFRQSVSDWIFRAKPPEAAPVTLVQRRIFILPTKQGYGFAFTLAEGVDRATRSLDSGAARDALMRLREIA